jgi:putative ubiquitin-RnfH superfamily antitoxin RatB of RatAB toxin-antitoxin module
MVSANNNDRTVMVEVAYATPARQVIYRLPVATGTTMEEAIRLSGVLEAFPEIDLMRTAIGVFGEPARLDDRVGPDDRIEIYRSLIADPKQARRRRATRSKKPRGAR